MKVSFIICTRNRQGSILECLNAIEVSMKHAGMESDCEVVVVDNGSTDKTPEILAQWADETPLSVQIIPEAKLGLSNARNAGFKAAQGEIIACTDDDCRLDENFVVDMMRHFEADNGALVLRGGRVKLGNNSDLPLSIKEEDTVQVWRNSDANPPYNLGDSLMGCSFTMRREVFEKIGLFDARLGAGSKIPGAEDTDYIYRAYNAGMTIEYVPDMALSHFHGRKTREEGRKLFENYAKGWGALYVKYAFRAPKYLKPFWWDFKNAISELRQGKNTFMPEADFSHKDKVKYSIIGAFQYLLP